MYLNYKFRSNKNYTMKMLLIIALNIIILVPSSEAISLIAECDTTYDLHEGEGMIVASEGISSKASCFYGFETSLGFVFRMSCRRFDLSNAGCDKEKVTLNYDDEFCGKDFITPYYSSRNYLLIKHARSELSSKADCSRGFTCSISVIPESQVGESTESYDTTDAGSITAESTTFVHPSGCACGGSDAYYNSTPIKQLGSSRIVGGNEAVPHSWPWTVRIELHHSTDDSEKVSVCTGSLISDQFVLTNMRCLRNSFFIMILYLGDHDVNVVEPGEVQFTISFTSSDWIENPAYNLNNLQNDIMLLKLPKKVTFTRTISPVCLYNGHSGQMEKKVMYVTGWGETQKVGGTPATKLQQVRMWLYPLRFCQEYLSVALPLNDGSLCWHNEGKGDCFSDDGSPGVYKRDDGCWEQVGLVSYTYVCGHPLLPSIGTRVAKWYKWIEAYVGEMPWNNQ